MATIVDEIKDVLNDAKLLEKATSYGNGYIRHGSGCDSSQRRGIRYGFVVEAEKQFIEEHQKEILQMAAKLCRESIGDLTELIQIKQ